MAHESSTRDRGHRQLDHTADLALEVWAPGERPLLEEAARAVVEILTGGAAVGAEARRRIEIDCVDADDRLVQWLNEIIYAAVVDGFLVAHVETLALAPERLEAEVAGEARGHDRVTTELKSATYHGLHLEQDGEIWRARVVIDV